MVFSSDFEKRHYQIPDYLKEINTQFNDAIMRVATAADKLFLDGINIVDVIEHSFLNELSHFTKFGLCYEAAAIAMFLLKDNPSARLVQGTAEYQSATMNRCDHAWVEFEEKGVPFAVDFTWFDAYCVPRIVHVDLAKSIIYHTCTYQEFWQMDMSQKLYKLCHDRKTSYILPWLISYRSRGGVYNLEMTNWSQRVCKSDYAPTGEKDHFMYYVEDFIYKYSYDFLPFELKYVTA